MSVKQFLNRVRLQKNITRAAQKDYEEICYSIYHVSSPSPGEKVQTSHQGDISELVEKMEKAKEKRYDQLNKLLDMQEAARKMIYMLKDPVQQAILLRRYILCQEWENIAVEMSYSLHHILKLHGQALVWLECVPSVKDDTKRYLGMW